ncbi:MAG: ATP-binding protein, partial [Acidobacteriota bacterium]
LYSLHRDHRLGRRFRDATMSKDRRPERLKDSRFVFGGLGLLLVVFSAFYALFQRGQGLPPQVLTNRVLFFALGYVNIILILTLVFILVRSFFRLLIERRSRILGSAFKTKLVVTAIALSLIPVLILFPFATRLLFESLDALFNLPVEELLEQAADTAEALSREIEDRNRRDAARVLEGLSDLDVGALDDRAELQRRLQMFGAELGLDYLAIYDGTRLVHATANPRAFRTYPEFRGMSRVLRAAMDDGEAVHVADYLEINGRLILAAAADRDAAAAVRPVTTSGETETTAVEDAVPVVLAGAVLPPDIAEKHQSLTLARQSYLALVAQKDELRSTYRLILLMVTLLVILAFTSISLRLARRVTVPIQALAEGTHRIRQGHLDHRVEVAVDDELGVLVEGFNAMTADLERNRELVDQRSRELIEANERITEEQVLLSTVLQNVAAGVLAIGEDGRIVTCNGAALRILAQRDDEVIGRPFTEAWQDPERTKLAGLLGDPAGDEHSFELQLTVGGIWKTLEVKVTSMPSTGTMPGGRVVVLEDNTELIHAQQMATWNQVARRIAHEIKNPLTPIKLTAERLLRKHQQNDPALGRTIEDGVAVIVREVASMQAMTDEFSRFARMPRPLPRTVDVVALVEEVLRLYREIKSGVEVSAELDPEASTVWFDREQLRSVLLNLLDNAIRAVSPPGQVVVRTVQRDHGVELSVADTGVGIRPEDREKIFLPYYSTKGRGTGLGLAIVHRIVSDHHATIRVDDNPAGGTVFVLDLPASSPAVEVS